MGFLNMDTVKHCDLVLKILLEVKLIETIQTSTIQDFLDGVLTLFPP